MLNNTCFIVYAIFFGSVNAHTTWTSKAGELLLVCITKAHWLGREAS